MSVVLSSFKDYLVYLRRICHFIGPYSWFIVFILIIDLVGLLTTLFQPIIGQLTIDEALLKKNDVLFFQLSIFAIIIFISDYLKSLFAGLVNNCFDAEVASKSQRHIFGRILRLPQKKITEYSEGGLFVRLTDDLKTTIDSVFYYLILSVSNIFSFLFILLVTLLYSYKIVLMALPFIPLLLFESKLFASQKAQIVLEGKHVSESVYNFLKDRIEKVFLVKIMRREAKEESNFNDLVTKTIHVWFKSKYLDELSNLLKSHTIKLWSLIFTIYLGYMVTSSQITFGQMTAIMLYFGRIIVPITFLFRLYPMVRVLNVSCKRLFELMDLKTEDEIEAEKNIVYKADLSLRGWIEAKDLSFSFDRNKAALFQNINFNIPFGNMVALTGRNGVGKTTLANILLKVNGFDVGKLLINGHDLNNIHLKNLREKIGYLMQDHMLLEGDKYGEIVANSPDILSWLKGHPFEKNAFLSGGEKRKLSILQLLQRGMFDIYIFDEFTNNFDRRSIEAFLDYIDIYLKEKTLIFITHEEMILKKMDQILVLEPNRVLEYDSYSDFICSDYAVARSQRGSL